jgi:hypothetical protein
VCTSTATGTAVDQLVVPLTSQDAVQLVVAAGRMLRLLAQPAARLEHDDHLPVTAFHLVTSMCLHEALKLVFKRVSVRLLSTSVKDQELVVDKHKTSTGLIFDALADECLRGPEERGLAR